MSARSVFLAICLAASAIVARTRESVDAIVYGSKTGGFCAAIAAAREGVSIAVKN